MRKIISLLLAAMLILSLGACADSGKDPTSQPESQPETSSEASQEASEPENEAGSLKLGMGIISDLTVSEDAAEVNSVAVAVLVDGEGKIVDCVLDEAQTKPAFKDGALAEPTDLRTKHEKQGDYNMLGSSGISKEWFKQADFFCDYVKDKTAEEIAALELTDNKPAEGTDLAAGCTISVDRFIAALTKAVGSAEELGSNEGDKLGLAVTTEKYYESNETNLQYDSNFTAVTVNAEGAVTACLVDAAQGKLAMDGAKFTGESGSYKSKKELQGDYGMTSASPIGKEWYEQAEAYEQYAAGKTADEITATELTDGKPTQGTDLASGCTITMTSIIENTVKAIGNAK